MKKLFISFSLILSFMFVAPVLHAQMQASLDTTLNPGVGPNGDIYTVTLQPDGKILIGGVFTSYNGTAINRLARLNTDGSIDTTFNIGTGANNYVTSILVQPDGKIIVVGIFYNFNTYPVPSIIRLNADGSVDTGFIPGSGSFTSGIESIALQPDGKIIIGGGFTTFNGTVRNRITRLNTNGSIDASFNIGTGASFPIVKVALQPDGKILISGTFTSYNGTPRNRIARLNSDGSLDTSFNPGTGLNNPADDIVVLPNSKILIAGSFTSVNGTPMNRIAQLNPNGTLDTNFNIGTGASGPVSSLIVQPDKRIVLGGSFSSINNVTLRYIARLNEDGTVDPDFNPMLGANNFVFGTALQTDGKIVIAGRFTSYNGTPINRIARIHNSIAPTVTAGGATTFCSGGSVVLTANSAISGVTYQWYNIGTAISGATAATYTANASGSYTVEAILNGVSSTASAAITVTVNAIPATPSLTAGGATTFCSGSPVTLTAASATTGATFQWFNNGTAIPGATSATYTVNATGSYTVVASANGCSSTASAATAVTVNAKPATPIITQTGNLLTASPTTGTYQWYVDNGTGTFVPISGATSQTYSPSTWYGHRVVVIENGCESNPSAIFYFILGISSLAPGMDVSVYPNPTAGTFEVNLTGFEKEATVQIMNVTGQVVAAEKVAVTSDKTVKAFDLGGLAKGVYILKVSSGDNLTFRKVMLD